MNSRFLLRIKWVSNSLFLGVKEFTILKHSAKTGPSIVELTGRGKAKGGRGHCSHKGDLQLCRGLRGFRRKLAIFVNGSLIETSAMPLPTYR
jgi:hypothetical protein